jgi:NADH dehydrogenase
VPDPTITTKVVIVGGGFAGVACAKVLEKHHIDTVLIDRNAYHQFQPMLYQLATAQVGATDIAFPLRAIFRKSKYVTVKTAEVVSYDVDAHSATTADGVTFAGDFLVLCAGTKPSFFGIPGAEEHTFPLYSIDQANALRSRIVSAINAVDADPRHIDQGGLSFVIVGGGATGVETAGAVAEFLRDVVPHYYPGMDVGRRRVVVVDHGDHLLNGFSDKAHDYAAERLEHDGVELRLGVGVTEITPAGVALSDGSTIEARTVVWGAGIQASPLLAAGGLSPGRGGRVEVSEDLSVPGHPGVYVLGDCAAITDAHGDHLPQLGSVAQQSGKWAGHNIVAVLKGEPPVPFDYLDKGIMAMIGRNAAVAEVGPRRHEVHGRIAFAAWLGVHAELLSSMGQRVNAFVDWGWDYFSKKRPEYLADRPNASAIDWSGGEDDDEAAAAAEAQPAG